MSTKPWYVYLLLCDEKTFYVGITPDLVNRVDQHKHKHSFFTKKFSHIKTVYCEKYQGKKEAILREKNSKDGLTRRSKCW